MKRKRKLLFGIIGVLAILTLSYFLVGNYFYNYALNAHTEKQFLNNNPDLQTSQYINEDKENKALKSDQQFQKTHRPKNINITSNDDLKLKLHATQYQHDNNNHKWVVIVHGYSSDNQDEIRWIRNFYNQGYNVLAPDLRGHGKSQGDYIGMGWDDRLDIINWLNQIVKKDSQSKIILWGISMGGATVMNASGEKLPENVQLIIEDCGFDSTGDIFAYQLKKLFHLPKFPVMNAFNTVTKMRAGYDVFTSNATEQLKKNTRPILFIHGTKDTFVPFEMLDKVYQATNAPKEKLVIKGAGHGESEKVNPDLYWQTIWQFIAKYSH